MCQEPRRHNEREKEKVRQTCRLTMSQEQREAPEQRMNGGGFCGYFLPWVLQLPVTVPYRLSINPVE